MFTYETKQAVCNRKRVARHVIVAEEFQQKRCPVSFTHRHKHIRTLREG